MIIPIDYPSTFPRFVMINLRHSHCRRPENMFIDRTKSIQVPVDVEGVEAVDEGVVEEKEPRTIPKKFKFLRKGKMQVRRRS